MEEQPSGPNLRRLIPIGVVFIIIVAVLMLLAQDIIREVVVLPISYLVYATRLLVRTTPQIFFWMATVLLLFVAAYRSLAGRPKKLAPTPPMLDDFDSPNEVIRGRASYWMLKAHLAQQGDSEYYQRAFHTALARLVLDVLAYRYRLVPNQIEDRLRAGTLQVPPEVSEYILSVLVRDDAYRVNAFTGWFKDRFAGLVRWFRQLMGRLSNSGPAETAPRVDPQVARILKFMEEELELEVLHDDANL